MAASGLTLGRTEIAKFCHRFSILKNHNKVQVSMCRNNANKEPLTMTGNEIKNFCTDAPVSLSAIS